MCVIGAVLLVCSPAHAQSFGDFFGRLNPGRLFRSQPAGESGETGFDPDQLREKLAERGLDEAEIEERINRIEEVRANGRPSGEMPDLDLLRAKLEERGIDADRIDERIARLSDGQFQGRGRRSGNRPGENVDLDQVRTRLEERGLDAASIDERIARISEMRASGLLPMPATASTETESASEAGSSVRPSFSFDSSALRERMEARGMSADQIEDRLARISARFDNR